MPYRCDFYSDEEYEYAVQLEIEQHREQLAYDEEFARYCEEEYLKDLFRGKTHEQQRYKHPNQQ